MTTVWGYTGGCDYYRTSSSVSPKAAQSIVAPDTPAFDIDKVGLYLTRNLDSGTIHVELYAADASGFPTGEVLSSGTVESITLPTGTIWTADTPVTEVTMSAYTVSFSGNGFVIVMYADTYVAESPYYSHVYWHGVTDGAYAYGVGSRYTDSWANLATQDLRFYVTGSSSSLAKPTTPNPTNGSGPGINFTNRTVSWVNGGGADTYTIRMDSGGTPYNVVSLSQAATSYTIPVSDLALYQDNIISWRVDAEAGGETVQGDVWTFDPRPAKATTPSPTDEATNTALNLTTLSWTKDAYTDESSVTCSWASGNAIETTGASLTLANYTPLYMDRLGYSNTYTWRVDTTNEFGTTDGDTWSFETIPMSRTVCSWENYDGKTKGPGEENGSGVEGVDYYWLGTNCISTVKRVVAFAADRVWITEI